jgi:ammonium transporter, Amt family
VAIATKSYYRYLALCIVGSILFLVIKPAIAQTNYINQAKHLDTLWLTVAGSLVFFMNAGFAMLEAGLCQARNSTNVLAKNLIVFCIAIFAFWFIGFGLMFGNGNAWIGQTGFFFQAFTPALLASTNNSFDSIEILYPQQSWLIAFFFQLVFAGTSATIVSGAMAERVKFWAFFWFSFCLVAIAYPLTGRWAWNPDGWLATNFNFLDFAGSSVVHSVGGMAGLVGAILIGPRRGWQGYNPDEVPGKRFTSRPQTFNYFSLSLSTLGCLILWLGWLGFNGGSVKSIADVPHVIVTTMLAGGAGGIFVLFLRGLRYQKATLSLVINGILGGLVSITASSVYVSLGVAILIGAVASLWVIFFEQLLEELHIDDPVGAIPVHLGCGIWGTLAAGLFANQIPPYINNPVMRGEQIMGQIVGILAINLTTLVLSCSFWLLIGLALYKIESLNNNLKKAADNHDLESELTANSTKYIKGRLSTNNFYKYFHFARTALRVSLQEEAQGSDGTFF